MQRKPMYLSFLVLDKKVKFLFVKPCNFIQYQVLRQGKTLPSFQKLAYDGSETEAKILSSG